jgi:hypothetical protein
MVQPVANTTFSLASAARTAIEDLEDWTTNKVCLRAWLWTPDDIIHLGPGLVKSKSKAKSKPARSRDGWSEWAILKAKASLRNKGRGNGSPLLEPGGCIRSFRRCVHEELLVDLHPAARRFRSVAERAGTQISSLKR